jgi:hypothetical protein
LSDVVPLGGILVPPVPIHDKRLPRVLLVPLMYPAPCRKEYALGASVTEWQSPQCPTVLGAR